MTDGRPTARGKWLVRLGQIVEPLVVRNNALQCTIASICVRLAAIPMSATVPTEHLRTSPSHGQRLRFARPRHRCPTMGCDEGGLTPGNDLFELDQLRSRIVLLLELVDADRCEYRHDGSVGSVLRHLLRCASERPSTPVEADNYGGGCAEDYPLQKTGQRLSLQD